jgi:multicomponent Na+:H+ antiporter subunit G
MPDLFNRIQTGTKASTLGTMLSLIGLAMINEGWFWKLLVIIVFVVITNPVSSNVIARAAHHRGIKLSQKTITDMLEKQIDIKLNDEEDNQCHYCNGRCGAICFGSISAFSSARCCHDRSVNW